MAVLSFRVAMGLPPTQEDENHGCRHPRVKLALSLPKRGGPRQSRRNWIPAFAGMTRCGWRGLDS